VISVPARRAEAGDAILGVWPQSVLEPSRLEEAGEVLREAATGGKALAFAGGGTQLELGTAPERLDLLVRTSGLRRIVEYSPSDQVVVAEAGLTLADLQRELGAHGQRLALDPPRPERATLGGIVAANAWGPRRARYGSVRDLLIGVSFFRADGVLARGGGKVVKNVAGFDMPRLLIGSLGTLGLVATTTFRLHPVAEADSTLWVGDCSPRDVREMVRRIREAQLEPAAALAIGSDPARFDLAVRFEGFDAGVAQQVARLRELSAGERRACEVLAEDSARALWQRHDALRSEPALRAKFCAPPDSFERLASGILPPLFEAVSGAACLWHPTLGVGFVSGGAESSEATAAALQSARAVLAGLGGTLTLEAAPAELRRRVHVWGPPPASLPLMRRVKERFDPERRLAPGRFVGGI